MKALDTNVVVRFLINDDEDQAARAKGAFAAAEASSEPLLITDTVLLELMWVLSSRYGFERSELLDAIEILAGTPAVCFEDYELVIELISRGRRSTAHLSDLLIGLRGAASGCASTLTFEKGLSATGLFDLV